MIVSNYVIVFFKLKASTESLMKYNEILEASSNGWFDKYCLKPSLLLTFIIFGLHS